MSDDRSDEDPIMDLWYSNWEQQCIESIESEPDYESQLHNEKEIYSQQIWTGFQTTASAIAQLYKDRTQGASLWLPFQTAAGTVTSLYKNSLDGMRRCSELGVEIGRQKRSKEIMNWARKKRRTIRREDLLAYLAGKPPPPRPHTHRSSPKPRMMVCGSPPSQSPTASMVVTPTPEPVDQDSDLHAFREAIALSGSPISRRAGRQSELSAFISSEFARHHKRPASHDVDMGSPTHKRSRFM
ncbi:HUWE1-associated protein modifying stress responses isoform X1 [Microplitis mediator]|uniref:HUWE1-associated protein modifying stress responses isoform X1 n=1 Tax=Microplitis mediator TaxID=375433 RepID=UPI00255721A1|nr:HUWE1-associated protein modifying stress responses isoform X1 [Microplitis mediator]